MKNEVASHYSQQDIMGRIRAGLESAGIALAQVSVDDLGSVDEFHTGGRVATEHLLADLQINANSQVLDIGCGIGGTSRFLADRFNACVSGIDLTPDYVEAGNVLNRWVSLDDKIDLRHGDASKMQFADDSFDVAVMMHVGMNIESKAAVFADIARTLKTGGEFALYDVMLRKADFPSFPLPWATDESMSFLEPIESYIEYLESAGFSIERRARRGDFAKAFFQKMQKSAKISAVLPAVGLHLLVGPSIKEKMSNFAQAIYDEIVEPCEIIARKK